MSYTQLPFTILKSSFKIIIALLFVGSLAMNIITMTWTAEGIAAKGAVAAVARITSVATGLGIKLAINEKVITDLRSNLAASEEVATGLRGELDFSEKVVTRLSGNLAANKKVVTGLRGELAANEKVITGLRGELDANEVTITDLGTKLAAKSKVIIDLGIKLAANKVEITDLGIKLDANKKAVSRITEGIAKRTIRGVSRSLAAIPADFIPYAGDAVTLGVTVFEIKDACATIEDMDEMNKSMGNKFTVEKDKACKIKIPSKAEIVKAIKSSRGKVLDSVREFGVDIPEDALEDISEDALEDALEDIPEDIPEDISEDTPEDAQEDEREDTGKSGGFFRNSWKSARKYFSDD